MEDTDRRFNTLVDFVNTGRPREELVPPIQNEEENSLFDNLVNELAELCRKYPDALLAHYDSECGFYDCGYDLD